MKRFFRILAVAVLAMVLAIPGAHAQLKGDTFAEAKTKKVANVTYLYIDTPGFSEFKSGKGKGLCVDLMAAFAKWLKENEGIELKPTHNAKDDQNFAAFMTTVKESQGGVFGLGNITISEERKKTYTFSPAYITNFSLLVTHKDAPNLQDLAHIGTTFKGMQAVTVPSTVNEKWIKDMKAMHYQNLQIKHVNTSGDVVEVLVSNPKTFANMDFTYYLMAVQKGLPLKRHAASDESTETFGIIMPKNSDWAPVMARFLTETYKSSPEYRKILSDNLGPNALKLLDAIAAKK
jgi:ABC-type amino acid transport substrate-binding protein